MTAPRDFRWSGAPDPDTGTAPLAPTPAAGDVPALLAEAAAWCADTTRALRAGLVADLAEALRRAAELHKIDAFMVHTSERARDEARRDQLAAEAQRDDARRERDTLHHELDALRDDVERLLAAECPADAPCPRLRATADERDRLARRLRAVGAIAQGARFRLDPDGDGDGAPCGWTSR